MFTFIQKMEGVDFKGALKILADKAGVELVPEDPKKRDERDHLYQALEEATRFFEKKLAEHKEALQYLEDRATKAETISKWRIGWAPDDWRQLKEYMNAKGYNDELLLQAGLVKRAEGGKQPFDVFRGRIMFPIMDPSGRVVGFSGRILKKDDKAPKYVNSPETPLFHKSEILFGYDKAKHGIHKLDFSLIVEGQFDVVLSHQAGYNNTVAVSGTALTPEHVSLLQRLSNRVVLALDADRAGIAAVKRAAELMLSRGIDLKVARLHGGKDPADLVKEDPKLLKKDIGEATHVIDFLLAVLRDEVKDDRTYKLRVRDEILPYLQMIDSYIERDHFATIIAEAAKTTPEAIRLELSRLEAKKAPATTSAPKAEPTPESNVVNANRKDELLAYVAVMAEILPPAEGHMLSEKFVAIIGSTPEEVRSGLPTEKRSELSFVIERHLGDISPRYQREEWEDRLKQLHNIIAREELTAAKETLREAENSGDENIIQKAIEKIGELSKKLHQQI